MNLGTRVEWHLLNVDSLLFGSCSLGWLLHRTRLALLRVGSWQGLFRGSLERESFFTLMLAEEVGLARLSTRSGGG